MRVLWGKYNNVIFLNRFLLTLITNFTIYGIFIWFFQFCDFFKWYLYKNIFSFILNIDDFMKRIPNFN